MELYNRELAMIRGSGRKEGRGTGKGKKDGGPPSLAGQHSLDSKSLHSTRNGHEPRHVTFSDSLARARSLPLSLSFYGASTPHAIVTSPRTLPSWTHARSLSRAYTPYAMATSPGTSPPRRLSLPLSLSSLSFSFSLSLFLSLSVDRDESEGLRERASTRNAMVTSPGP